MNELTHQNPHFFYPSEDFPHLLRLTENFAVIKSELIALLEYKKEEFWHKVYQKYVDGENPIAWKMFTFLFFQMKSKQHAKLCPLTASLIYSIPEIISCDFSFLEPKTKILPHLGYSKMVLRCHLPLIVPEGNKCAIRVGNETHFWKEGELVIFDDSFEHEAWNDSDRQRVVLMFDIPNPNWGYSADEISKYKIENLNDPYLLSIANKEKWLKSYQDRQLPLVEFD